MAVELKKPVFQIVGYQNSGKTTLVTKLITMLANENIQIGTIKHHGHGGAPDLPVTEKDSDKHRQAGAAAVLVEGDGTIQMHAVNGEGWQLQSLINLYERLPLDAILVEGYKKEGYPKAVLIRTEEDLSILATLSNIRMIISWVKLSNTFKRIPVFSIEEEDVYLQKILTEIKRGIS